MGTMMVSGILVPHRKQDGVHCEYNLFTDRGLLTLYYPKRLAQFLRRHLWENLMVQGVVRGSKLLVKVARLENEDPQAPEDTGVNEDILEYQRSIDRGEPLELEVSEVA